MDLYGFLVTILSLILAVLAWLVKLRWSKEFEKAKNEIISARDAEIATLRSTIANYELFNPKKMREYNLAMKEDFESCIEELTKRIESMKIRSSELEKMLEKSSKAQEKRIANYEKDLTNTYRGIATISHELRTPLNGMLGFLELSKNVVKDENVKKYLQIATDCANRLLDITSPYLDLSKIKDLASVQSTEEFFEVLNCKKAESESEN